MIILRVRFEVLGESVNSLCEQCNLDFGRACIRIVRFVLTDYFDLSFLS